jgi:hypothetical protein
MFIIVFLLSDFWQCPGVAGQHLASGTIIYPLGKIVKKKIVLLASFFLDAAGCVCYNNVRR